MAVPEKRETGPAPGTVAPGNGGSQSPAPAVAGSGRPDKSFLSLGGLLRGRGRKDGLPAGSGAAQAADKEKERTRKADYRERKAAAEPPPVLPPAVAKPGQPVSAPGGQAAAVPGGAPDGAVAPIPGEPGTVSIPLILWTAPDLAPVTDAAVPLMEEILTGKKLRRLRNAKIDPDLVKKVEKDFAWPEKSKSMLSKTGAALGAKYLNKVGISAAYKDEVNFGMALLVILRLEASLNSRLDKLIAAAEKAAGTANSAPAGRTAVAPLTVSGQAGPAAASPTTPGEGLFPTEISLDSANPTKKK